MRLYYCDHYELPLPPGHKFPVRKYRLLRDILSTDPRFEFAASPFASTEQLTLVHNASYVEAFLNGTLPPSVIRRIGFPWSENLVLRTLASVGGTVCAAHDALARGASGGLAGGTHHAFRDEGSGFCVFNDIAVAIEVLRHEGLIRRAAIVDLDVHQGDGTAAIFQQDADVLTISAHGKNNFPFRKQASRIDIELDDGIGDDEYLRAIDPIFGHVLAFAPDIVFFQSGVDALYSDKLGRLRLTHQGMLARDRYVIGHAMQSRLPLVITLGGGYSEPIELTVEAHATTFRTAVELS